MYKKFLLLLFIIAAGFSTALNAQESKSDSTYTIDDENDDEDCSDWSWGGWSSGWDHDWGRWDIKGKPTIEATYGVSEMGLKPASGKLANTGAAELKLSYSSLRKFQDYISSYKNNFAFVSNNSMDLTSKKSGLSEMSSETWRFGLGWQTAYAYQFGKAAIIPYNSNAIVWTRLNLKEDANGTLSRLSAADAELLGNFDQTFRFGTLAEGGLKLQVVPVLTLNAGYERAIVFPRHMFWKHAGSVLIEAIGMGAIESFVREVIDSSPAAGPVVNFVLKNGFSYAIYQLRREKMNWPFATAAPLTYDTWKIGMTFTF